MSYTRSIVSRDWWDGFDFPTRLRDQNFGLGLSELDLDSTPSFYRGYYLRPRRQLSSGGTSEVKADPNKFQVRLDVGHFAPEEITVKTVDDHVVVTACHEEKVDEHGYVSRQFSRRYMLPEGVEAEQIASSLSPEGVLVIEAPRKRPEPILADNERLIPVKVLTTPEKPSTTIPVTKEKSSSTNEKK